MSSKKTNRSIDAKPNATVITRKMTRKQTSTEKRTVGAGARPCASSENDQAFMPQLNEKVVNSVPPSMFLFARLITPAMSWHPAPKRRQKSDVVRSASGVTAALTPNAIGKSDAHAIARPRSPSVVGSANGGGVVDEAG